MQPSFLTVDGFFEQAADLRRVFEEHFAHPGERAGEGQQIWDYWHVPGSYTYMRTNPVRLFADALVDAFRSRLQAWALETLGMAQVTEPYLSLYVNGCVQTLHNDAGNGRWGYVYSLTPWDQRTFSGGETLIFPDHGYWNSKQMTRPGAGASFYNLVPPRFNQLLVFDDRLLHAVPQLQGSMHPIEGRVVLHGHLSEGATRVTGTLSHSDVEPALSPVLGAVRRMLDGQDLAYHGCVALRLMVNPAGAVDRIETLTDRIVRLDGAPAPSVDLVEQTRTLLWGARFPSSPGVSLVTVALAVGDRQD